MKKAVTLTLASTLLLGLLAGCGTESAGSQSAGAADTSLADASPTSPFGNGGRRKLLRRDEDSLTPSTCPRRTGPTRWSGRATTPDSPYFAHPDFYNMESTDTLTILDQLPDHPAVQRVELRGRPPR